MLLELQAQSRARRAELRAATSFALHRLLARSILTIRRAQHVQEAQELVCLLALALTEQTKLLPTHTRAKCSNKQLATWCVTYCYLQRAPISAISHTEPHAAPHGSNGYVLTRSLSLLLKRNKSEQEELGVDAQSKDVSELRWCLCCRRAPPTPSARKQSSGARWHVASRLFHYDN